MPARVALLSYGVYEGKGTIYPPLHLCNLAGSLANAGHEVRVFDYNGPFAQMGSWFRDIADFRPDFTGLSCFTPHVRSFHGVTKELRAALPDTALVVGGYHPTAWPAWSLEHMPQFDYAMHGECDYAIVQLAELIEGRRSPEDVKGLV